MFPRTKRPSHPWDSLDVPLGSAIEMIYEGRGVGASLFSNAAAVQDGATTEWIARNQGVIVSGDREVIIDGSALNESSIGAAICNDKELTKKFLLSAGVRTPRGRVVRSSDDVVAFAEGLSGMVVVKPVGGGMGRGVSVGPRGEHEIRQAYKLASGPKGRRVLVEERVDIESEYRCMATGDECVSVIERILPSVVGDGETTVRNLVRQKNEERSLNPGIHNLPIPLDRVADSVLSRQGLDLDSIPVTGQKVLIRNVGGLSGGGDPIDRFEQVAGEVKTLAHQAIQAIPSLSWGGVDIAIERHTGVPFVLEINTMAGYGAATFPVKGRARDVASVAWRQRRAITRSDSPKRSDEVEPRHDPRPVSSVGTSGIHVASGSTFASFFFAWLASQGYEVKEAHQRVIKVSKHGNEKWLGRNAANASDLLAVHRVVRRHNLVRLLLARKGVPRVRGRLMHNFSGFERFFKEGQGRFVAVPKALHWGTRRSAVIDVEGARRLFKNRSSWVVQTYPEGNRLIVFATRTSALAVLQRPGELPVADPTIQAACNVAVDAVRAIPELRWAIVGVIAVGSEDVRGDLAGNVLVEGMNINIPMNGNELVIAGSMEDVFHSRLCG